MYPPDWIANTTCLSLGQYGSRSPHLGGANFAMGDGSVKFIKNSINVAAYRGLGTRAGSEIISTDAY
jgi:prepilin-type processing-associated H-X9-DG protein